MYEVFEQLLQKYGISSYKVAKEAGVTQTALSNWKTGKSVPATRTLQKIADYFGVTIDYLMTGTESQPEDRKAGNLSNDDISTEVNSLRQKLERDVLFINGEPLDDKRRAALISVLELALENAEESSRNRLKRISAYAKQMGKTKDKT